MRNYWIGLVGIIWAFSIFVIINPCSYIGAYSFILHFSYKCSYEVTYAPFLFNGFIITVFPFLLINASLRHLIFTVPLSFLFTISLKVLTGLQTETAALDIMHEVRWEIGGICIGAMIVLCLSHVERNNCKVALCIMGAAGSLVLLELGKDIHTTLVLGIFSIISAASLGTSLRSR